MSELKDWAPELNFPNDPDYKALYLAQQAVKEALTVRNRDLLSQIEDDRALIQNLNTQLKECQKSAQRDFALLKADAVATLNAINLMVVASICTDNHWLTHRARNFRMKYLSEIASNCIKRFEGKELTNWLDDF